ncbi:MAG: hypothetical protein J4F28_08640 [Nitrosopumilaceae archaeon]|nr:hypothetical protein [Nitrosopumilaceae archaeon]
MSGAGARVGRAGAGVWRRIRRVEDGHIAYLPRRLARVRLRRRINKALRNLDEVDAIARGVRSDWTDMRPEARGVCDCTGEARRHLERLGSVGTAWRPPAS